MIRLVYMSFVLIATWLAGCSKGPAEFGQFAISWEVLAAGNPIPCEDVDGAAIEIDVSSADGEDVARTAPCDEQLAATRTLPLDDYELTLSLLDSAGVVVADETIASSLDEPEAVVDVPVDVRISEGRFAVTWRVVIGTEEDECPAGSNVEIEATSLATQETLVTRFNCVRFSGLTERLVFGDYAVTIRLLDSAGGEIASVTGAGASLSLGNRVVPLMIDFQLTAP